MSEKADDPTPSKPSDIGLADEPEPPIPPSSAASSGPSTSNPSQPAPSTSTASAAADVPEPEVEEETTPTATNPAPPSVEVEQVDITEDPEDTVSGNGQQVKASFRSASWKSVTPEFTAPLPFQSMIIIEEFDVEGAQWSGKAWQMVTTTATDPTSWFYSGELVFQGTIRGRKGKCIFRSTGSVSTADGLDGTLELIPETASDELAGLRATSTCKEKEVAPHLPIRYTLTLV
ncbi:hypothetical protein A1Q1_04386 [Trichosporon asahii var. asahii CBS 2479]|uniref:Uncharacterized protein n=1 Tax=Trichosporon asahii var. asahii (strain ATCC 90039 / CBS 2479 / JCM 2466 / KCTC 7840 / NBRC 103889/ NCYC 2677 / UAMH 7654) TaxID=1186058 RepID=J6EQU9_TRIAS|nr:hypothetical protein A1Q1_04386 [Trichosporon asahii var. asahii CBS 2479]EJT46874.1 hypothetical protein A1Q1_04386 [Trichosporon asahii var. asahii CBS 2479]